MKKFKNFTLYAGLFLFMIGFSSCQDEIEEISTGEEEEVIQASSNTARLIEKATAKDGSFDNIVDGTSCFGIKFPYTVTINGLELTIGKEEDLERIEEIFDKADIDDDILEILFPVTIIAANYTEITINSIDELYELASECTEDGEDDDIECIDFTYPVTLYTFSISMEQTGSITVSSDRELRRFFDNLEDDELVSFDFPITLSLYDGTQITVENTQDLARAIENAKDACDEDDDSDYNDDDYTQEELIDFLTECEFYVAEVKRNGTENSEQYQGALFYFNEDGTVKVMDRSGAAHNGTWEAYVGEQGAQLALNLETLMDFTLDWKLYERGETEVKLYKDDDNKVVMKQICDGQIPIDGLPGALEATLIECSWSIAEVTREGEDIDRLLGHKFNFMEEGGLTLGNGTTTTQGSWEVVQGTGSAFFLVIAIADEPGVSFEWPIGNFTNERSEFRTEDGKNELELERTCGDNTENDPDVGEVNSIMMEGSWKVASYIVNEDETAANYAGYSLLFGEENLARIFTGEEVNGAGFWVVSQTESGNLIVNLSFEEHPLFKTLTNEWRLISMSENSLELEITAGDGSITTLVLEKI